MQSFFPDLNNSHPILAYFGQFPTYSKVSQVHAIIIQNWQDKQKRPVHQFREHFLLFHYIYNILQCFFPDLNNSHPILAYFRQIPTFSKVSQVHAIIIQNWQDIQKRPVHQFREHFLLFHYVYNTLQCFVLDLINSHPILAYFGQFPTYSKVRKFTPS